MTTYTPSLPLVLLLAPLILLGGCLESKPQPSESVSEASQDSAMEHAAKHLDPKYVCPMHPQIVRDDPGSCPICGMDLVKKMLDAQTGKHPTGDSIQQTTLQCFLEVGEYEVAAEHEIERALGNLPAAQREAMMLTKIAGLSVREASAVLGI